MKAYMRNLFDFLGIPTPLRRKLSREFIKAHKAADWDFINKCWEQPEREFQYLAMDCLNKLKHTFSPGDIPGLERLITEKSWWDTVDALDVIVGDIALRHPEVNGTLLTWSISENIWLRRTAIDHQLTRKEKTDTALFEKILENNLGQSEFFINKAIGWSLREYSKTCPDWVRTFIKGHKEKMSPLSVREASKYTLVEQATRQRRATRPARSARGYIGADK
jgi:3-methyladenine DNA glycosylase AlkD